MKTEGSAFSLRQNKFVDRRLFIELLRRLESKYPLRDYLYVGLGGLSLEDHRLMYRDIGITKLVSLDWSEELVRRQVFNRPVEGIKILRMTTTDCVQNFWPIMESCGLAVGSPVTIWLDYTSPSEIYQQLSEVQSIVRTLAVGDILRVTFNANPAAYPGNEESERIVPAIELQNGRLQTVKARLGDFLPPGCKAEDLTYRRFPGVLVGAFKRAIQKVLGVSSGKEFVLLTTIRYSDKQQMLTITGILVGKDGRQSFLSSTGLESWEFFSSDWDVIHNIDVPELTLRERLFMEQLDPHNYDFENTDLAIKANAEEMREAVLLYKRLYRHYPQFHHVQV